MTTKVTRTVTGYWTGLALRTVKSVLARRRPSVTALLGAGATLDIGGKTTAAITATIRRQQQTVFRPPAPLTFIPFLDKLASCLDNYYSPARSTFEDVFEALEAITTYKRAWDPMCAKEYKPPFAPFAKEVDPSWFNDNVLLLTAGRDLIEKVASEIATYDEQFDPIHAHKWYASFWQRAIRVARWNIASLNYDDCVEKAVLPAVLDDGYEEPEENVQRFNPTQLRSSKTSRILHLHGSLRYGYARFADLNKYIFEDVHEDLYKHPDYASAKQTWFGRSSNIAQSGDNATAGPIITGLRKPDKLLAYPYSSYQFAFEDSLVSSGRILVAGYSFTDKHINRLLERITRLHGDDRRVVLIDYFPDPDKWHMDPSVMGWPSHDMFTFIAKVTRESIPFKSNIFESPLRMAGGRVLIFLRGLRDALENHTDDIMNCLCER